MLHITQILQSLFALHLTNVPFTDLSKLLNLLYLHFCHCSTFMVILNWIVKLAE